MCGNLYVGVRNGGPSTNDECLRSGVRMVCKKNTDDLYWFGPRNSLCPVGEESSVLSCTEVLVVGVTSECEKREELPSLKVGDENVGVCDSAGALARSRRVIYWHLALCYCGGCSFFWGVPLE
jgi:hypothetical protein